MIEGQGRHQKYQISILTTAGKKEILQSLESTDPGSKTTQCLSPTVTNPQIPNLCGQKYSS